MTVPRRCQQRGFSLVELMIALVIALLLLAGILQILLSNRQSYSAQQSVAVLQENSRLISFVIENVVAHAGYRVAFDARDEQSLFPPLGDAGNGLAIASGAFVASAHVDGSDNDDGVRLRFQAAGGVHDCAGTEIDGYPSGRAPDQKPLPATADFALVLDKSDPKNITLECLIYDDNDTLTGNFPGTTASVKNTVPLVDGVDRFKVRYGIDTDDDFSVDRYVSTLTPTTAGEVLSLRLQVLLHSDDHAVLSPIAQSYQFFDGTSQAYNDRRARSLLDQTVALRNVLP